MYYPRRMTDQAQNKIYSRNAIAQQMQQQNMLHTYNPPSSLANSTEKYWGEEPADPSYMDLENSAPRRVHVITEDVSSPFVFEDLKSSMGYRVTQMALRIPMRPKDHTRIDSPYVEDVLLEDGLKATMTLLGFPYDKVTAARHVSDRSDTLDVRFTKVFMDEDYAGRDAPVYDTRSSRAADDSDVYWEQENYVVGRRAVEAHLFAAFDLVREPRAVALMELQTADVRRAAEKREMQMYQMRREQMAQAERQMQQMQQTSAQLDRSALENALGVKSHDWSRQYNNSSVNSQAYPHNDHSTDAIKEASMWKRLLGKIT